MKLKSDFKDYYDGFFDGKGNLFERYRSDAMTKEMAVNLALLGLGATVGEVKQIKWLYKKFYTGPKMSSLVDVFVSDDEKITMEIGEASEKYPKNLCVLRPDLQEDVKANKTTLLYCGNKVFLFGKKENGRSVMLQLWTPPKNRILDAPLFSVERAWVGTRSYYVGVTVNPSLEEMDVKRFIKPKEIGELLNEYIL